MAAGPDLLRLPGARLLHAASAEAACPLCEPLTARQELIAELEGLGYDTMPGVAKDWPDWRTRLTDAELRGIIDTLHAQFADRDLAEHVAAEAPAEADDAEFPDVGEMIAVIREVVAASDAVEGRRPSRRRNKLATEEWLRFARAMSAARDLLATADRATAAAFPSTEVSA